MYAEEDVKGKEGGYTDRMVLIVGGMNKKIQRACIEGKGWLCTVFI